VLLDHIAKDIHSFSLRALPWADDNGQETDERINHSADKVYDWLIKNNLSENPDKERPSREKKVYISEYFQRNAYFASSSVASSSSELESVASWEEELKKWKQKEGSVAFGSRGSDVLSREEADNKNVSYPQVKPYGAIGNNELSANEAGMPHVGQGKLGEAEAIYRQVLEGEKELGREHQDTLTSASQLSLMSRQGKYKEAESMHQGALEGREKVLGLEHDKGLCPIPECGRVFKDLKAHMLTHQNWRPEKCPITACEYHLKGFARKYDKDRHTLTHYKGTMVCGFCPGSGSAAERSFNRADVFKRHLISVHGVEQAPPNSHKKSPTGKKAYTASQSNLAGTCSTCSVTFANAQEFYEHLNDCVLRVVQQANPSEKKKIMETPVTAHPASSKLPLSPVYLESETSEGEGVAMSPLQKIAQEMDRLEEERAINQKLLLSMADDKDVKETVVRNGLPNSVDHSVPVYDEDEEEEEEGIDVDNQNDDTYGVRSSRSGKGALKSRKNTLAYLALTYREQGRWKEAEELEVLGEEHPDTLTSMANLASTYRDEGQQLASMNREVIRYTPEQLQRLRESPLVHKSDGNSSIEQWMETPSEQNGRRPRSQHEQSHIYV